MLFFWTSKTYQKRKASNLQSAIEKIHSFITEDLALDGRTDYQILTPSRKWVNGINKEFQQLNAEPFTDPALDFKAHDKVMQTRNDYTKGVYCDDRCS